MIQFKECKEVQKLFHICKEDGLIVEVDNQYIPGDTFAGCKDASIPFVVIEGLDGSGKTWFHYSLNALILLATLGKTTLAKKIQQKYLMRPMETPPSVLSELREFFDSQTESLRRAFYSLGNYLASRNVLKCKDPVIMDR